MAATNDNTAHGRTTGDDTDLWPDPPLQALHQALGLHVCHKASGIKLACRRVHGDVQLPALQALLRGRILWQLGEGEHDVGTPEQLHRKVAAPQRAQCGTTPSAAIGAAVWLAAQVLAGLLASSWCAAVQRGQVERAGA